MVASCCRLRRKLALGKIRNKSRTDWPTVTAQRFTSKKTPLMHGLRERIRGCRSESGGMFARRDVLHITIAMKVIFPALE